MKVKVGNKIYDAEKEPIMVVLSDRDKKNIANMLSECTKYCSYPDHWDEEEIKHWMETE